MQSSSSGSGIVLIAQNYFFSSLTVLHCFICSLLKSWGPIVAVCKSLLALRSLIVLI